MRSYEEIEQTTYVLTGDEINKTFYRVLKNLIKDDKVNISLTVPIINVEFIKELERGEYEDDTNT